MTQSVRARLVNGSFFPSPGSGLVYSAQAGLRCLACAPPTPCSSIVSHFQCILLLHLSAVHVCGCSKFLYNFVHDDRSLRPVTPSVCYVLEKSNQVMMQMLF